MLRVWARSAGMSLPHKRFAVTDAQHQGEALLATTKRSGAVRETTAMA